MLALAGELSNPAQAAVARAQAGLQLKQCLTSKDDAVRVAYEANWLALDDESRNSIKTSALATLGTETSSPSIAAQVIAAIGCIEIPQGLWLDVVPILLSALSAPGATELHKIASLETIGYICDGVSPACLEGQSNDILTGVVQCLQKSEPSDRVRHGAAIALLNSIEFCASNFERDAERNVIMQVVCEATQSPDHGIAVPALQTLVKIVALYYKHMEQYMAAALFGITVEAMRSPNHEIAMQGIEFWTSVCDEEINLDYELSEVL